MKFVEITVDKADRLFKGNHELMVYAETAANGGAPISARSS